LYVLYVWIHMHLALARKTTLFLRGSVTCAREEDGNDSRVTLHAMLAARFVVNFRVLICEEL